MTKLWNLLTLDENPILSTLRITIVWYLEGMEAVGGVGWSPETDQNKATLQLLQGMEAVGGVGWSPETDQNKATLQLLQDRNNLI